MDHSIQSINIDNDGKPSLDLRKIITEEVQEQLQEAFAYATGFGVVFIDCEGRHIGGGSNFQRVCAAINETTEGRSLCAQSNRRAIEIAFETGKASIYVCHAGMVNIEIPIVVDGEFLGSVTAGQVFAEDENDFPSDPIKSVTKWKELEPYASYYKEVPTLNSKQIHATAASLEKITQYIIQNHQKHAMQEEIMGQKIELREKDIQLTEARYRALVQQVKPHFIFNVLNTVLRLIEMGESDKAHDMLSAYARMTRYQLQNMSHLIDLSEELKFIESYLNIQKIRFDDLMIYEIKKDPRIENLAIPFFSIQPFVKNALEHGILQSGCQGKISLNVMRETDRIKISITDNGEGIDDDMLKKLRRLLTTKIPGKEHLGMRSCYLRFKNTYIDKFLLDIYSVRNEGTRINIYIYDEANPERESLIIRSSKNYF